MTAEEMDDHLPPPAPAGKPVREKKARASEAPAPRTSPWPDRGLFLAVGLLAGFAAAYLYLDKNPSAVPQASLSDPHAGLVGVAPGPTPTRPACGSLKEACGTADGFLSRYRYAAAKPARRPTARNSPRSGQGDVRGAGASEARAFFSRTGFPAGAGGG